MQKKPRLNIPRPKNRNPETDNYYLIAEPKPRSATGFSHSSSSFRPLKFLSMRNKARLHLALYALPKHPDTYYYALLIRPKDIAATLALSGVLTASKYHVKTTIRTDADGAVSHPWIYETYHIHDLVDEPLLLASIVIGKLSVSTERISEILRHVPTYQDDGSSGRGTKFNDVEWTRLAIDALRQANVVSDDGITWEAIFEGSLNYMRRKQAEGRWEVGWKGGNPDAVATFDLITRKDVLF